MTTLVKEVTNAGYHYFDWNVDSSDAWSARNSNDVYNNVYFIVKDNKKYFYDANGNIVAK